MLLLSLTEKNRTLQLLVGRYGRAQEVSCIFLFYQVTRNKKIVSIVNELGHTELYIYVWMCFQYFKRIPVLHFCWEFPFSSCHFESFWKPLPHTMKIYCFQYCHHSKYIQMNQIHPDVSVSVITIPILIMIVIMFLMLYFCAGVWARSREESARWSGMDKGSGDCHYFEPIPRI